MGYDVFISYNSQDQYIAEMVCHSIEKRNLKCFIAPRDIISEDWAGNLDAAISESKAFVIIVSAHSIESMEVAKEITLATRVSDYIFPFRIDSTELNGRMNYHLSAFQWINAATPPIEQRINELSERVAHALLNKSSNITLNGNRNKNMQRLISQSVSPRSEFLGRDAQLQQLHELLTSGTNAVFLTGMGGIGKSELAKAYALMHKELYPTTVFVSYETDLLHLITNDQAITVTNLQQASATGGQGETTEAYFQRKMNVLRGILNEQTLLIIDNFDVESDEYLNDVLKLPCKQIWTTRTDFSDFGYVTMPIGPLDNIDDLVNLMTRIDKIYPKPDDQNALREIILLLQRHTLAISLTAAQMKASHISPRKMLEQLQNKGLNIQTRSVFSREQGQQKATAYEFIRALFDFSKLENTDHKILQYLGCMPREGVDIDLFMECCNIDDFGDIRRLVDLNWVQIDDENDRISLHMLVKQLVWDCLTPTLENCKELLQGALVWATNAWNKHHDENCSHSSIIYALLETFPQPSIDWLDCFEEFATFAWIQGRFDLSERCEHYLYQLCEDYYGPIHVKTGNQALRVAAVYYNQGDYSKARPWYEKGLHVQESIDPNSMEATMARTKVARSDGQLLQYHKAKIAFEKNLEIRQQLLANFTGEGEELRKMKLQVASAKQYVAHVYSCMGDHAKALPYALEAEAYFQSDTVEPSLIIYALTTLIGIYYGLGDYEKAMRCTKDALKQTIHYHGEQRIDYMILHEIQGDLLVRQGLFSNAQEEFSTALGGREKFFPADTASISRLEEKYSYAQQEKATDYPLLIMWP